MQTQLSPIDSIIPYPKNPRTHSETQVERIAKSIKEFGFNQPIVVDEKNIVLVGHGRLEAAKKLGLKEVPTLQLKKLSETQKGAYRVLDNKLQNDSTWDFETLELELKELESNGFELEPWGLDDLKDLFEQEDPEVKDDDFDESECENDETFIKLGDLIELGAHRVMCGDSTKSEDVDYLMCSKKSTMIFTDPPYALFGNSTGVAGISDDKMVRPFFRELFNQAKRITEKFGHIYICCDWHSAFSIEAISREVELKAKNLCIWDKGDGGVGAMYQQCYEMIWFFANSPINRTTMHTVKRGERVVNGVPNIWRSSRVHGERLHNAQKPIEIVCIPIENGSDFGDIVADLFLGSGSTLIAADQLGRICYGMEISPKYCHVIIERYKKYCKDNNKPFVCKINGEKFSGTS